MFYAFIMQYNCEASITRMIKKANSKINEIEMRNKEKGMVVGGRVGEREKRKRRERERMTEKRR